MTQTQQQPQMPNVKITDLVDEMKNNYLTYAEYVIRERAIPDVRDGLKPVHRRILWAMWEGGYKSTSPYRKSARVVGDCMGKYHPHGDSSIYSAMARLAQPFSLNQILVDGQGNFGSVDNPTPAAYRYTEARLSKFSEAVYFADIEESTIDFIDNYDGLEKEPSVLPTRIPMILLTAPSGIAVGMATDIPPHNLNEVCDATLAYLSDPNIDVKSLLAFIQSPDVPLGGLIRIDGCKDAYETGHGSFPYRVVAEFESEGNQKSIVIKSIPYSSCKDDIVREIAMAVNEDKISGIKEVRDESTKHGIRICVEVAARSDSNAVLNSIFKHTRLQSNIKANMVAICGKQPRVVGLKNILDAFVTFRRDVVRRRTIFRKQKAEQRKEIIDGILIFLSKADQLIKIVRAGTDTEKTLVELMKHSLSRRQAEHVYNMPLRRLSAQDEKKLKDELAEITPYIQEQQDILKDKSKLDGVIRKEIKEIQDKFGVTRRTQVTSDFSSIEAKDTIKEQRVSLIFLSDGTVKSTPIDDYRLQKRRGQGVSGVKVPDGVVPDYVGQASTHDNVMVFTDQGHRYRLGVHLIPALGRGKKPQPLQNYIPLFQPGERVVSVTKEKLNDDECLVMLGSQGKLRKLKAKVVNKTQDKTTEFYPVSAGGRVVSAIVAKSDDEIIMLSKIGMVLRTSLTNIREVASRKSVGSRGIKLKSGDEALSVSVVPKEGHLLTVSKSGFGKRTDLKHYIAKGRGRKGSKGIKLTDGDELLFGQAIMATETEASLFIITNKNVAIRLRFNSVPSQGRTARGTAVKKLEDDEVIASVAVE